MKSFVVLCVFALVVLTAGLECDKGTYMYSADCGPLLLEPSCDLPHPKPMEDIKICDFQACYCSSPTVRDFISENCVTVDKCPKTDFQTFFDAHPELHHEKATNI